MNEFFVFSLIIVILIAEIIYQRKVIQTMTTKADLDTAVASLATAVTTLSTEVTNAFNRLDALIAANGPIDLTSTVDHINTLTQSAQSLTAQAQLEGNSTTPSPAP